MNNLSQVLPEIEAYLSISGMAATTFGQKAVRDWQLVERLRKGGDVTMRNADRIRGFIREQAGKAFTPKPRIKSRPASRKRKRGSESRVST